MCRHRCRVVAIAVAGLEAGSERDDSEEWEEVDTGHAAEHSLVEEAAEVVADKLAVGRVAAGPVDSLVAGQEVVDSRAAVLDRIATW